jgi:hypothetical protein
VALTPSPAPNPGQALRFWWLDHGQALGLVLGAAAILLFGVLLVPQGAVTVHTGHVTGFRALSSETGTNVYATVQVDGHPTLVRLHAQNTCSVGDSITLRKARFPLGERYAVQGRGCASSDARPSIALP